MTGANGYEGIVRLLIRLLHDGENGFSELGAKLRKPELQAFYREEAIVRRAYASELGRTFEEVAGVPAHETRTLLGPVHQLWLEAKSAFGAGDVALLDSTQICERMVTRNYQEALEVEGVPAELREVLVRQASHVARVGELLQRFATEAQE